MVLDAALKAGRFGASPAPGSCDTAASPIGTSTATRSHHPTGRNPIAAPGVRSVLERGLMGREDRRRICASDGPGSSEGHVKHAPLLNPRALLSSPWLLSPSHFLARQVPKRRP